MAFGAPLMVTTVGDQDAECRRGRRQANQRGRQRRPALADRPDPPWTPADRPARVAGGGARLRCGEDRAVRDGRALTGGQRRCGHVKDVAAPATRAVRSEGHLRKRGPHLENRPPSTRTSRGVRGNGGPRRGRASALLAADRRVGRDARQRRVDAPPGRSGRSRSQASIGAWHCGAARSWPTSTNGIWLPGGGRPGSLGYQYRVGRLRTCRSIASAATIAASALKKKPIAPGYPLAAEGSSLECLASPASGLRSH